jgi:hypothetical protein
MEYCRFLELYKKYTTGNETPELIHTWVGLAVLAGACEKRIWLPKGFFNIYMNLYLLFVAPPGVCNKSTSMGLGAKLLNDAGMMVFEGATTKAKIVMDMAESIQVFQTKDGDFNHSSVTFISDEFNTLLSSGGPDIVRFFTEIFSKETVYNDRTKSAGTYSLPNPFLNFMANMVPKTFGDNVADEALAGGLIARFIIIYEDATRGKYPDPVVTPDQYAARAEALEMLFNLADKYGPLSQSKEAHAFYNDWYCAQMIDPQEDPKLASYYVRKVKLHVPKLASLMAIGDGRFQVEKIDYVRALHLLHKTEKKLKMVHLLTGGNKYVHHMSRIQHILEANGGKVPMRDLMRMFFQDLTMEEFKAIITQLDFMDIATKREIDGVLYLVAQ